MPMSETLRKQNLYAEIIILVRNLNEAGGSGGPSLSYPSQEEVSTMTVQELEAMKRELRDLARSLGGTSNR